MASKRYCVRMDIYVDSEEGDGEAVQTVYDQLWGSRAGDYDLVSVEEI